MQRPFVMCELFMLIGFFDRRCVLRVLFCIITLEFSTVAIERRVCLAFESKNQFKETEC